MILNKKFGVLAKGYPQRTIFDNVYDAELSFGIYFQDVPAVLFYRNLRKLKYVTKFHPSFRDHARRGSLPNYAVIEQHYLDSKLHPAHDVYQGQMFIKEIYETLRASPQWNQTLMVVTYDEHGGFFDHVPTPVDGVPSPDGIVGPPPYNFTFDRLGVRVPAILISPWIEKGTGNLFSQLILVSAINQKRTLFSCPWAKGTRANVAIRAFLDPCNGEKTVRPAARLLD
jgi:phospholipase C